jgi:hypothetical protein
MTGGGAAGRTLDVCAGVVTAGAALYLVPLEYRAALWLGLHPVTAPSVTMVIEVCTIAAMTAGRLVRTALMLTLASALVGQLHAVSSRADASTGVQEATSAVVVPTLMVCGMYFMHWLRLHVRSVLEAEAEHLAGAASLALERQREHELALATQEALRAEQERLAAREEREEAQAAEEAQRRAEEWRASQEADRLARLRQAELDAEVAVAQAQAGAAAEQTSAWQAEAERLRALLDASEAEARRQLAEVRRLAGASDASLAELRRQQAEQERQLAEVRRQLATSEASARRLAERCELAEASARRLEEAAVATEAPPERLTEEEVYELWRQERLSGAKIARMIGCAPSWGSALRRKFEEREARQHEEQKATP